MTAKICKTTDAYQMQRVAKQRQKLPQRHKATTKRYKMIMKGKNDYKQIQNYFKERLNDFPFNNPLLFKLETTKHLLKELGPHYLLLFSHLSDFLDLSVNCLAC